MNQALPGTDWGAVVVSSAKPLPSMWATNWGKVVNVGSNFDQFERDKGRLFHELAHTPQWTSGELTRLSYASSAGGAFLRSLQQAWTGRGLQSLSEMHDSISVEQLADAVRDELLDAYDEAGKPCEKN